MSCGYNNTASCKFTWENRAVTLPRSRLLVVKRTKHGDLAER